MMLEDESSPCYGCAGNGNARLCCYLQESFGPTSCYRLAESPNLGVEDEEEEVDDGDF